MKSIIELPKPALWFDMETGHWKVLSKPDRPTYEPYYTGEQMREFAALVRAQVLEEAAGVCDEQAHDWHLHAKGGPVAAYNACAAAIRALKDKT